jgi:anti-sigma factor RsiW
MSEPTHDLERLISRHLDHEATPAERRELNARLRREPESAALYEEYSALDREVGYALRSTRDRPSCRHRPLPLWERTARVFVVAAAACLAVMFWFNADRTRAPAGRPLDVRQAGSWFAPLPSVGDTLVERPERFNRPEIQVRKPRTNWIVIPSETPGEFLVVEVNRVLTRTVHIQHDF